MKLLYPQIEEITWLEARPQFQKSEPVLAKIIDKLSPGNTFTLLKISYPFGSMILDKGGVHLPIGGYKSAPLSHSEVSSSIKDALSYSNLPLGCITNNHGVEVYREAKDKFHSIAFLRQGLYLGIWEFFSSPTSFSISAGARSLMILPKISDCAAHCLLKPYGIHLQPPLSPYEQWRIFRKMAISKNFATPWSCEVVYFTSCWAKKIKQDPAWAEFRNFLLNRAWEQTEHGRNRFLYDEMWESFFSTLSTRKIKPISYILDLFKYLIYLAQGTKAVVAFRPTDGEETAGPVSELLRVYLDVYKLKTYAPTLMLPAHFADDQKRPIYCSLQIPAYWDSAPKSRDSVSVKRDLEHLIWVMDTFRRELSKGNVQATIPMISQIFEKINFDFFHTDGGINERIKPSSTMPQDDENLLYMPKGNIEYGKRSFADRCSFMRGCVRISSK